ncbi:MAG: glycerophosphodiester phosphodiesterase [Pseudomonadota bacterium]
MAFWPYPFWFAHRGAGQQAPENTLAAFRVGAAHGFNAFECDVKLSADGVPYLLHDDTLDRTTTGRGAAQAWSWSDLSQLDAGGWLDSAFAGEPPASLAAVAAFCVGTGSALNLELKPCPGQERLTGRSVARWLRRCWPANALPALLSSFEVPALEAARDEAPESPRALLLDQLSEAWLRQALDLDCTAVVVHHPLLSEAFIDQAHAADLKVLSYTVNDATVALRLKSWQVDGLITDAVDRLSATNFTF